MTDRELIELAARAAGYGFNEKTGDLEFIWTETEYPKNSGKHGALWNYIGWMDTAGLWNPLESDADAFRLAVELGIDVHTGDTFGVSGAGFTTADCFRRGRVISVLVPHGDDPYAATRRAITRAAAEIGRKM